MTKLLPPAFISVLLLAACGPGAGADSAPDDTALGEDADGDGYSAGYGEDCDDSDAMVHPGAAEYCDGLDNDCDLVVDEGALDTLVWYADADGDGYGDPARSTLACQAPSGWVSDHSDCDDADAEVHPGASEADNGLDDDCDAQVDESGTDDTGEEDDGGDGPAYGAQELRTVDSHWLGDSAGDGAGAALAGGHDLTGDGAADILVGAPDSSAGGQFYLLSGADWDGASGAALGEASASGAVSWTSSASGAQLGATVALLPDVDGDGAVDMAVGAPGATGDATGSGLTVLWFSSQQAYYYVTTSAVGAGMGVTAAAGDADADGLGDILVGGPGLSASGEEQGFAELFLGDREGLVEVGALWTGISAGDALGSDVHTAGDIDGDGFDDLLLAGGGYPAGGARGAVWVVMGQRSWSGGQQSLTDAEHLLIGLTAGDRAGAALAGGQDFDADGYEDFVVATPDSGAGAAYLFAGGAGWATPSGVRPVSSALAALMGEDPGDMAAASVDMLEDLDHDGAAELLIGAPHHSQGAADRGKAYVALGGSGAWTGVCSLANAELSWVGERAGDHLGMAVSTAGDVDVDGHTDLLLGSPGADDGGNAAGTVYLVLGW